MYAWSVDCIAWQQQRWFHFTVLHDGGVPGGGTASWGDTAHVPRHQGGPDHHPGHRHHNRQHPNATPSQGWLAGAQLWLNSIQWVCGAVLMPPSFPPALAQLHSMGVWSCSYAPLPPPPPQLWLNSIQWVCGALLIPPPPPPQLQLNSILWVCGAVLMSPSFSPALAQLHPMGVWSCSYAPLPPPPQLWLNSIELFLCPPPSPQLWLNSIQWVCGAVLMPPFPPPPPQLWLNSIELFLCPPPSPQLWLNSIQWVCGAVLMPPFPPPPQALAQLHWAVLMSPSFSPALAQLHPMGVQSCTYAPHPTPLCP